MARAVDVRRPGHDTGCSTGLSEPAEHLPELTARFSALGIEATPKSAADFTAFTAREVTKWTDLVKAAGIEPAD